MEKNFNLGEVEKRRKILQDHSKGEDPAIIADRYGYHVKSVLRIIKRFAGQKNLERARGAGRPRMLSPGDKIAIANCVRKKPWLSSSKIKQRLQLNAQPRTIRRFLESQRYRYKKPYKKPKLSNQDKLNRVDWALKNENYDFSRVVFADECSIWMTEWQGRMWIKKGGRHYIGTRAYYPKVHVWGAIGKDGIVGIHVFTGNLTAPKFIAILKESLVPEANKIYGKRNWSIAQDNDPKHRAKGTTNFFKSQKVTSLKFF